MLRTAGSSSFWRYWAPPVLWTLVILVVSGSLGSLNNTFDIFKWVVSWIATVKPDTLAPVHFYLRKALHFLYYGILTVLWWRALTASWPERPWTNSVLALVLCLLVASFDEGHQYFSSGRTASWWDVALDMSGGLILLVLSTRFFTKKVEAPVEVQLACQCHLTPGPSGLQSQKRRFIFKK